MKKYVISMLVVVVLATGAVAFFWWRDQPQPLSNFEPMRCIYSDTIEDDTAVPNWTTMTIIPARSIDQEKLKSYEPLQELTLGDRPLAWRNTAGTAVVDNTIFSDLKFVDVTGFGGDVTPIVIGQVTKVDLQDNEWRTVLQFLLKSHIIRTYVHLNSEVCLDQETNTDSAYTAHFTAVHRYCTNACHEQPYEFTVTVDKQTKNISVK